MGLHLQDKEVVCNGEWLSDKHVAAMNKILQRQFPMLHGLQDTLVLARYHKYDSQASKFVQVVNISNQHWIAASNLFCSPGVVEIYDSLPNYSFNSSTLKEQVATVLKTEEKSFQLHHVDVQRQSGGADCALFAIAFIVTLALGEDPHITSYKQDQLRCHFVSCVDEKHFTRFPAPDRPRRLGRHRLLKKQEVPVFCKCRLPWNRNSTRGPLVECQSCKEWFHQECMGIEQSFIDNPKLKYNCKFCLSF